MAGGAWSIFGPFFPIYKTLSLYSTVPVQVNPIWCETSCPIGTVQAAGGAAGQSGQSNELCGQGGRGEGGEGNEGGETGT